MTTFDSSLHLTTDYPTPHEAAREILGPNHPKEADLVALLRLAYSAGFEDGGEHYYDDDGEDAYGNLNEQWAYRECEP